MIACSPKTVSTLTEADFAEGLKGSTSTFLVAVAAIAVAIIGLRDSEAQAKRSVVGLVCNGIIIAIVILTYLL